MFPNYSVFRAHIFILQGVTQLFRATLDITRSQRSVVSTNTFVAETLCVAVTVVAEHGTLFDVYAPTKFRVTLTISCEGSRTVIERNITETFVALQLLRFRV